MKIYIATPVNARNEATIEEKRKAAYQRVLELQEKLRAMYPDAEFHSSFDDDIAPITESGKTYWSEPTIMGACVQRVMECDVVFLDVRWHKSKGCRIENAVANEYGKRVLLPYQVLKRSEL